MRIQTNIDSGHQWALILAAGEGSRLRSLTTTSSGIAVPKQFCSLRGHHSLFGETVLRAQRVVAKGRICAIVAEHHENWWAQPVQQLARDKLIVQP